MALHVHFMQFYLELRGIIRELLGIIMELPAITMTVLGITLASLETHALQHSLFILLTEDTT